MEGKEAMVKKGRRASGNQRRSYPNSVCAFTMASMSSRDISPGASEGARAVTLLLSSPLSRIPLAVTAACTSSAVTFKNQRGYGLILGILSSSLPPSRSMGSDAPLVAPSWSPWGGRVPFTSASGLTKFARWFRKHPPDVRELQACLAPSLVLLPFYI